MPAGEVALAVQVPALPGGDDAERVREDALAPEVVLHRPGHVEGEVEAAGGEVAPQLRPLEAERRQRDLGGRLLEAREDRRQEQRLELVRQREGDAGDVPPGIELPSLEEGAGEAGERLADRGCQLDRQLRRRHPSPLAREEDVAEVIPEPRERVADRRLRHAEHRRRPAQAPFRVDDVEDPEEVEVEPVPSFRGMIDVHDAPCLFFI